MTRKFILAEDIEDDGYNCYFPATNEKVFNYEIYISKDCVFDDIAPMLNKYIDWLSDCKSEIIRYFENKTNDGKLENKPKEIEVYNASITFNSLEDFGATVVFGENASEDQIFELNFDKFEIINDKFEE